MPHAVVSNGTQEIATPTSKSRTRLNHTKVGHDILHRGLLDKVPEVYKVGVCNSILATFMPRSKVVLRSDANIDPEKAVRIQAFWLSYLAPHADMR
jgi:hypothetical protein